MKSKPAEVAAQEKTAFLDSILHSFTDMAIIATDLDFNITYYSPAAEEIYGYKAQEVIGKTVMEIHAREGVDPERLEQAIAEVKQNREHLYLTSNPRNNRQNIIENRLSGIRDGDNTLIGYVVISRNVTKLWQAESQRNIHLHYLESIDQIERGIRQAVDITQMMDNVTATLLKVFSCDRAWLIYPCDPNASHWHVPVEHTQPRYPGAFVGRQRLPVTPDTAKIFQDALNAKAPVCYGPGTERAIPDSAKHFQIQSQLSYAVQPRMGEAWLLGMHQCSYPREWTGDEIRLFQDIANRLTDGISNLLFYQSIKATQQEWEESFNAVGDQIAICDMSGTIIRTNKAMRDFFEPIHGELLGLNYRLIYFGASDYKLPSPCSRVLASGKPEITEIQIPTMGGWQQISAYPRFDSNKQQLGAVFVIRDITQNKQYASELYDSKQRYRMLVETMSEGLGVQDKHGVTQYVNDRLCKMLGYDRRHFIGRPIGDLIDLPDINPQQLPDTLAPYEVEVTHRNGSKVFLHVSPQIIKDEAGKYTGRFAVFTDITERKHSEERLRKLSSAVEQSPNAIIITDRDGIIEYVNPCFSAITGYSLEEAIGKKPSIIKSNKTSAAVHANLWHTIKSGHTWTGEVTNQAKDGSFYLDHLVISPIKDDTGQITHYVSIQTNITEQRQTEEQARLHQAELAHVSRLNTLGEMASGLAHELNQPLAAIYSYSGTGLELLNNNNLSTERLTHILEQSHAQARRAGKIIKRMRRMIRKERAHKILSNINALIRDACALAKPDLQRHEISLKLELDNHLPRMLADSIQIEQVILNLLRNAIEATQANNDIIIRSFINEKSEAQITVEDSGHGMDEKIADNLFTPFFTTKPGGLGVGLSLSRSIIEFHGGQLWMEPNAPQGSRFHFTLPLGDKENSH
jgi:PAS domain S-box-containing protein